MRLIDADELKADLRQYFTDGVLDGISARLAFNQILHDIDNAPTIETSYDLYREETCERKAHCYDYEYWHCIGCHGCKADVRGGKQ